MPSTFDLSKLGSDEIQVVFAPIEHVPFRELALLVRVHDGKFTARTEIVQLQSRPLGERKKLKKRGA